MADDIGRDDIFVTLRDIAEQTKIGIQAAKSVGDPYKLEESLGRWGEMFGTAADEVFRLRKENEMLRAALEPFVIDWIEAGKLSPWIFDWRDSDKLSVNVTVEHLNRARTALNPQGSEPNG